jgi:transposase-like protein
MERFTIAQFNEHFPDDDACLAFVAATVYPTWPDVECRKCEVVTRHHRLKGRKAYTCQRCGTHVYPLAGTIFEKSSTPMKSWFYAMYLVSQTRGGISAKQLERELGVTYKTAWRMFKQIRTLLDDNDGPLSGTVEVDETWHGGKRYFLGRPGHTGQRPGYNSLANKTPIVGAVERGGRVKAKVVKNVRKTTLVPLVVEHVMDDAMVFTDEHSGYTGLTNQGYAHRRVNHSAKVYVEGEVHTNTIEGFWMLLKNGIRGTYHSVGKDYLQTYVNEYVFRYNHRNDQDHMFKTIARRVRAVRSGQYGAYAPFGD